MQQKLSRGVNDALFTVPSTPAQCSEHYAIWEQALFDLYPFLTENELVGKPFARRDTEINGMALYVTVCGKDPGQAWHGLLRAKWASKCSKQHQRISRDEQT